MHRRSGRAIGALCVTTASRPSTETAFSTLLLLSSSGWHCLSGGCDGLHDVWVEASGQGAFEASDDVEFVAAVGVDVTAHVGPGLVVPDEANDDDAVQGGVGLPVAAAVKWASPLSVEISPMRRGDGRGQTEVR